MKKKLLSIFVIALMLTMLMPTSAFACPDNQGMITVTKEVKGEKKCEIQFNFTIEKVINQPNISNVVSEDGDINTENMINLENISTNTDFPLKDNEKKSTDLDPGTYIVTENADSRYTTTVNGVAGNSTTVVVVAKGRYTINFVNTFIVKPTTGTVTITKDVVYASSEINPIDSHEFLYTYTSTSNNNTKENNYNEHKKITGSGIVSETSSESITLPFGTYVFTETAETGYTGVVTQASVTLDFENQNQTIKFVNSIPTPIIPVTGSIIIHKTVDTFGIPASNTALYFDFTVIGDNYYQLVSAGAIDAKLIKLPLGTYVITELQHMGYTRDSITREIPLTDASIVRVDFNNTTITTVEEPTLGSITIHKTVNDNATNLNFEFTVVRVDNVQTTVMSNTYVVTAGSVDAVINDLPLGSYTITETVPDGYTNSKPVQTLDLTKEIPNQTLYFNNVTVPETTTTTTTTTTRRNSSTPTTPPPVIAEPEVPLAEMPAEMPVIFDPPTPLADAVPQTSDSGNIWLLLGLLFSSGFGIAVIRRKKQID